jgi:predicted RNA-binding protein with PUA-like domain
MPRFWLLKCEPDVYSIADLERDGRTGWDSVRNYQVRNFMRDDMQAGDLGVFYHSNAEPSGAAGVLRVVRPALPDPTQFDPKSEYHDPKSTREAPTWLMCEVEFVERFPEVVPLERLRAEPSLAGMLILRKGNRLSVTPLEEAEFKAIRALGAGRAPETAAGASKRASAEAGARASAKSAARSAAAVTARRSR